jgi:hypothetical protein
VYTLRCTGKLLARLGPVTEVARDPPTTVLGDWYGTLVYAPGMQLVLLVSERTLLPLVVPAREARTLAERLPVELGRALAESRQILGSMNDFRQMMMAHPWPPLSLTALSLELAEAPCGPIGMRSPDELTRELFAAPGRLV